MKIFILLILLLNFSFTFAGIIRDDANPQKHIDLANQSQFNCVGQILRDSLPGGSCVLINKRYALTAAHVLVSYNTKLDTTYVNGIEKISRIKFNLKTHNPSQILLKFGKETFKIKNVTIFPEFYDNMEQGYCDLAILELTEPCKSIKPAILNSDFDELNSKVKCVGFGPLKKVSDALNTSIKGKNAGENIVDSIGNVLLFGKETQLICDFDNYNSPNCNKIGSSLPTDLEYFCTGGDSGSGMFFEKDNELKLIGICNRGTVTFSIGTNNDNCKYSYMYYSRVSAFYNWIKENTK